MEDEPGRSGARLEADACRKAWSSIGPSSAFGGYHGRSITSLESLGSPRKASRSIRLPAAMVSELTVESALFRKQMAPKGVVFDSPAHRQEIHMEKLSKSEIKWAKERLKHYGPSGAKRIAKNFKSKREREAIAAVFDWMSMNSVVGWYNKNDKCHLSTVAYSATVSRKTPGDVLVMESGLYHDAEKLLVGDKP